MFGELILRRKLPDDMNASYTLRKRWHVECSCGKKLTIPEWYLIRPHSPKRSCGHLRKTNKTIFNQEYRIWLMMLRRCSDEKHVSYKRYGGRGIKVCEEWANQETGFEAFLAYIGPRPSPKHTIDRVDNNQGYQPFFEGRRQVRWATPEEQASNKG